MSKASTTGFLTIINAYEQDEPEGTEDYPIPLDGEGTRDDPINVSSDSALAPASIDNI